MEEIDKQQSFEQLKNIQKEHQSLKNPEVSELQKKHKEERLKHEQAKYSNALMQEAMQELRIQFQKSLNKLSVSDTREVAYRELKSLIEKNSSLDALRTYLGSLRENRKSKSPLAREIEVSLLGYLSEVYKDRLIESSKHPLRLIIRLGEIIQDYFKDLSPVVRESAASSMVKLYQHSLPKDSAQVIFTFMFEPLNSILASGIDTQAQQTAALTIFKWAEYLVASKEISILNELHTRTLSVFLKLRADFLGLVSSIGLLVENCGLPTEYVIPTLGKCIQYLKITTPRVKIETCKLLALISKTVGEIEGVVTQDVIQALKKMKVDPLPSVQNSARDALKAWTERDSPVPEVQRELSPAEKDAVRESLEKLPQSKAMPNKLVPSASSHFKAIRNMVKLQKEQGLPPVENPPHWGLSKNHYLKKGSGNYVYVDKRPTKIKKRPRENIRNKIGTAASARKEVEIFYGKREKYIEETEDDFFNRESIRAAYKGPEEDWKSMILKRKNEDSKVEETRNEEGSEKQNEEQKDLIIIRTRKNTEHEDIEFLEGIEKEEQKDKQENSEILRKKIRDSEDIQRQEGINSEFLTDFGPISEDLNLKNAESIEIKNIEIENKDLELRNKEIEIQNRELNLKNKEIEIENKESDIHKRECELKEKELNLSSRESELRKKESLMDSMPAVPKNRDLNINKSEIDIEIEGKKKLELALEVCGSHYLKKQSVISLSTIHDSASVVPSPKNMCERTMLIEPIQPVQPRFLDLRLNKDKKPPRSFSMQRLDNFEFSKASKKEEEKLEFLGNEEEKEEEPLFFERSESTSTSAFKIEKFKKNFKIVSLDSTIHIDGQKNSVSIPPLVRAKSAHDAIKPKISSPLSKTGFSAEKHEIFPIKEIPELEKSTPKEEDQPISNLTPKEDEKLTPKEEDTSFTKQTPKEQDPSSSHEEAKELIKPARKASSEENASDRPIFQSKSNEILAMNQDHPRSPSNRQFSRIKPPLHSRTNSSVHEKLYGIVKQNFKDFTTQLDQGLDYMKHRIKGIEERCDWAQDTLACLKELSSFKKKTNIKKSSSSAQPDPTDILSQKWNDSLNLLAKGDLAKAYEIILDTRDDLYLIRLMLNTGPCLRELSRDINNELQNRIIEILCSDFIQHLSCRWLMELVTYENILIGSDDRFRIAKRLQRIPTARDLLRQLSTL